MGPPSPVKEICQTSHQAQVNNTNTHENKDAYNLAFAQATKLVAEERKKGEGEIQRMTQEIIGQVEGGFAASDFPLILINKYVANGHVGEFTAMPGMEGRGTGRKWCPLMIRTFRWQRGQSQNWHTHAQAFLEVAQQESAVG